MILLLAWLLAQDPLTNLIEELRSDSINRREEATRKLKEAGSTALPLLRRAEKDPDVELSRRAGVLLRVIPIYETLTPALRKAIPGVEERLALEAPHVWTETFLAALSSTGDVPTPPTLAAEDVEALAARALDGAPTDATRSEVCRLIGSLRLKIAWTSVVKLLESPEYNVRAGAQITLGKLRIPESIAPLKAYLQNGPPQATEGAIAALQMMWHRDSIPDIQPHLGNRDPRVRIAATHALIGLDARESFPKIAALLEDKEATVRETAIRCLGYGWDVNSVPAIVRCIKDPDVQVRRQVAYTLGLLGDSGVLEILFKCLSQQDELERTYALSSIGSLGAADALPRIREQLKDPNQNVRMAAALSLRNLNGRQEVPRLLDLLKDEDESVRFFTAGYLGELGIQEAAAEISGLLKEQSRYLGSAMWALALLDRREFIPKIVEALDHPDDWTRNAAATALCIYRAREAAPELLKALGKETNWGLLQAVGWIGISEAAPLVRRESMLLTGGYREIAARTLCLLGVRDGAPIVVGEGNFLTTLNALRSPKGWQKIRDRVLQDDRHGTRAELAGFLAKECGMRLEGPKDLRELWSGEKIWIRRSASCSHFPGALDQILGMRYDAIIDEDRIVILPRYQARLFWEAWWEAEQKR